MQRATENKSNALQDINVNNFKGNYNKNKHKLLFLGDSQGRGVSHILHNNLPKCVTEVIFKPNANFAEVLRDINNLTKNFTTGDTVIISAGTNDALLGTLPDSVRLMDLFASMERFNVICTSVPYWKGRHTFNKNAYDFNLNIFKVVERLDFVTYVDVNVFLQKPSFHFHLSRKDKMTVFSYICKIITEYIDGLYNNYINYSNLVYVPIIESSTETNYFL